MFIFKSNVLFVLLVVTAVYSFCVCSFGYIIGVDFGSQYIKVAGLQNGRHIGIVINEFSKRKTANYICLHRDEWNIGDHANVLAARFPNKSAAAVNLLMGRMSGDMDYLRSLQLEFATSHTSRGDLVINFHANFNDMSAEELYAMFLTYMKKIAEHDGVQAPKGAVITLPYYARMRERRAVMRAARLANVSVLRFIDTTTAAALYYGIRNRGFQDRATQIFVLDIGAASSKAGVFTFLPSKSKQAAVGESFGTLVTNVIRHDEHLSGRALDLCVAQVMENEAVATMNIARVLQSSSDASPAVMKAHFALLRAANSVRERLSVNTDTPYTVEGIAVGRDFHSTFTRATFERECAPLLQRVQALVGSVLSAPEINTSTIQAYELIGGTSRTPRVIADVSAVIGRDVDRTLNMDEAAATGAGYLATKLSPFYNAKGFKLMDKLPYSIYFTVDPPHDKARAQHKRLLVNYTKGPSSFISVSLNRTEDFTLNLYEHMEGAQPPTEPVGQVAVGGVRSNWEEILNGQNIVRHGNNSHVVRVEFFLNEGGVPEIESAAAIFRYAVNSSAGVQSDWLGDGNMSTVPHGPDNESKRNGGGDVVRAGNTTQNVSAPEPMITMRTRKVALNATLRWLDLPDPSHSEVMTRRTRLQTIEENERIRRERALARNNLEAYLYWVKNDKYEELRRLSEANGQLVGLQNYIADVQDWLEEGEGSYEKCPREHYLDRLATLQSMVEQLLDHPKSVLANESASTNGTATSSSSEATNTTTEERNDDL